MVARYFSGGEFMGGKDVLMGHASTENRSLVTYLYTVVHTCLEYNLEFPNLIRSLRHLAAGQTFSPPPNCPNVNHPPKIPTVSPNNAGLGEIRSLPSLRPRTRMGTTCPSGPRTSVGMPWERPRATRAVLG